MDGKSLNISEDNLLKLSNLFPGIVQDGKVDKSYIEKILGLSLVEGTDKYELNWAGKSEAYKVLQEPTMATLIPEPQDSVNWDTTENVFIEGENLEVLKVLQKSYYGKIKMIYIDPPYNTGSDSFIYPDKFSETKEEYLKRIGDKDDDGYMMKEGLFRKNNKESGQFHSNWLNMMLPRLFLAKNLLKDDGVIFISIDDHEQANLKLLLNEIFGEENFVCQFTREAIKGGSLSKFVRETHDYIFVYAKNIIDLEFEGFEKEDLELNLTDKNGPYAKGRELNKWGAGSRREDSEGMWYPIPGPNGEQVYPIRNDGTEGRWRLGKKKLLELAENDGIIFEKREDGTYIAYEKLRGNKSNFKQFITILKDKYLNATATEELKELFQYERAIFDFSKPTELIKDLMILAAVKDGDIVLDFFAGSGSTASAVLNLNAEDGNCRKFICVQLPEITDEKSEAFKNKYFKISDITSARIKKVIDKIEKVRKGKLELEQICSMGFRKYKLASSNFKIWRSDFISGEEDLKNQMSLFVKPEKENTLTNNILWELLIKSGNSLTGQLAMVKLKDGATIYHTLDKKLAFILDKYNEEVLKAILEMKPNTVVCLDSLFQNDDKTKTNTQLKLEDNKITFKTV